MPKYESDYFGMQLGQAISSGAGHISEALQRKYAMQRRDEEMARREQLAKEETASNRAFEMQKLGYDNTPEALDQFIADRKRTREQNERGSQADIALKEAQANKINSSTTDIEPEDFGDPEAVRQMGMPSRKNPYKGMSEKMLLKVKPAAMALANKEIASLDKKAEEVSSVEADMKRAREIIGSGLSTGPIMGRIPGRSWVNEDVSEFERIANTTIPRMRVAGSGTTSDKDMEIYRQSTIGMKQPEQVNKRVIDQTLALSQRIKDKAEFMSKYVALYGDLHGAIPAWKEYVNANPLFNDKGDVLPVKHYSDMFGGQITTPTIPQNEIALSPEKAQRLMELRQKAGR